jgi:hypothetical protein
MLEQALLELVQSPVPDGLTFTYNVTAVAAVASGAGMRKKAAANSSALPGRRTLRRQTTGKVGPRW